VIILAYLGLAIFNYNLFYSSILFFYDILIKILPIFVLIFVLMSIVNYFVSPKAVASHLTGKGTKKWFYVIIGGILSTGPIYMWYPLLADLKNKGLSDGLIATFLYNRAIKLPLLPLAIIYFSLKYIIVLSVVMIFISVVQGIIIDKIMKKEVK